VIFGFEGTTGRQVFELNNDTHFQNLPPTCLHYESHFYLSVLILQLGFYVNIQTFPYDLLPERATFQWMVRLCPGVKGKLKVVPVLFS